MLSACLLLAFGKDFLLRFARQSSSLQATLLEKPGVVKNLKIQHYLIKEEFECAVSKVYNKCSA